MRTSSTTPVIQRLLEIQRRDRLNDRQMAERIGIERSQWAAIRLGLRGMGIRTLNKVLSLYPELAFSFVAGVQQTNTTHGVLHPTPAEVAS